MNYLGQKNIDFIKTENFLIAVSSSSLILKEQFFQQISSHPFCSIRTLFADISSQKCFIGILQSDFVVFHLSDQPMNSKHFLCSEHLAKSFYCLKLKLSFSLIKFLEFGILLFHFRKMSKKRLISSFSQSSRIDWDYCNFGLLFPQVGLISQLPTDKEVDYHQ
jgi:hypothetical protein